MEVFGEVIQQNSGESYKLRLKNFANIGRKKIHSTETYDMAGYQWKLACFLCRDAGSISDNFCVVLLSCNAVGISADTLMTVVNKSDAERSIYKSMRQRLHAFHYESITSFGDFDVLKEPQNGFVADGVLHLTVEICRIKPITTVQTIRRTRGTNMEIINVELIDEKSIVAHMKGTKTYGVVSNERRRSTFCLANELIDFRVQEMMSYRQWLCQRTSDGRMVVKQCLDCVGRKDRFGDICETCSDGQKWMTVFVEKREDFRCPQQINEETILLFCKLHHKEKNEHFYMGNVLMDRRSCFSDLLSHFQHLTKHTADSECEIFLEGINTITKITAASEAPLVEIGLKSGSVVIACQGLSKDGVSKTSGGCLPCVVNSNGLVPLSEECLLRKRASVDISNDLKETGPIVPVSQTPGVLDGECQSVRDLSLDLQPESIFAGRYCVKKMIRKDIFMAVSLDENHKVALKFFESKDRFQRSRDLHKEISSQYVCRVIEAIYEPDGYPPCLVFDMGGKTLDEWMQKPPSDYFAKKAVLREILTCLSFIHNLNFVHSDLRPLAVMFSYSEHRWQLLDLGTISEAGAVYWVGDTTNYDAPEIIRAKGDGREIVLRASADMWSFGFVSLDVLTGKGDHTNCYDYLKDDKACSRVKFQRIGLISELQSRDLVAGLLNPEPSQRPSADESLIHEAFQPAIKSSRQNPMEGQDLSQTLIGPCVFALSQIVTRGSPLGLPTQQALASARAFENFGTVIHKEFEQLKTEMDAKLETVHKPILDGVQKVREAVDATYREFCTANVLANIQMEQLTNGDAGRPFQNRRSRIPHTISDDFVENEPVFVLRCKKDYRLRISLVHKCSSSAANLKISYILARPSDGIELRLNVFEVREPSRGHEVVAMFPKASFESTKLSRGCQQFGWPEEKYLEVELTIGVEVATSNAENQAKCTTEMKKKLWCLPISERSLYIPWHGFKRTVYEWWEKAPQWIRNAARGAIIVADLAVNIGSLTQL